MFTNKSRTKYVYVAETDEERALLEAQCDDETSVVELHYHDAQVVSGVLLVKEVTEYNEER